VRRAQSERSYDGLGSPANPCAARRSRPRWSGTRYSITWSARNKIDCGIVRPSALAVLRLITRSILVGCSTGKSAGLPPGRRISSFSDVPQAYDLPKDRFKPPHWSR
jgi:hypothetical protein